MSRKLKFGVDEGAFSKDQHGGDLAKESETLCVLLKMLVRILRAAAIAGLRGACYLVGKSKGILPA